jgi:hypothetical protein
VIDGDGKCEIKDVEPEEGDSFVVKDYGKTKTLYVRERPSLACGTATPEFRKV